MSHGLVAILANWATFVALFLVAGSAVARLIGRRAGVSVPRFRMLGIMGAVLAVGATLLRLLAQVLNFLDPGDPFTHDAVRAVLHTTWGTGWAAQFLAAGCAVVATSLTPAFALLGALALAFTLPLTGHAADFPLGFPLGVVVHGVHAMAAATWLGTLGVVIAGWLHERRAGTLPDAPQALARLIRGFSPVALGAAAALVMTGVVIAVTMVQQWSRLTGTSYGRLLLAKLSVLAAVLALGAMHWKVVLPRLGNDASSRQLVRSAVVEVGLALVILLLTASLVSTGPM